MLGYFPIETGQPGLTSARPWSIPGRLFGGQPRLDIAKSIDFDQKSFLRAFFGVGYRGAISVACAFQAPPGLTRQTLEQYHEIARQTIQEGQDSSCVQSVRLCLVERALSELSIR